MRLKKINFHSRDAIIKAYHESVKLEKAKPHPHSGILYAKFVSHFFLKRAYLSLIPGKMSYLLNPAMKAMTVYRLKKAVARQIPLDKTGGVEKMIAKVKKQKKLSTNKDAIDAIIRGVEILDKRLKKILRKLVQLQKSELAGPFYYPRHWARDGIVNVRDYLHDLKIELSEHL